jgi:hypothetical protein
MGAGHKPATIFPVAFWWKSSDLTCSMRKLVGGSLGHLLQSWRMKSTIALAVLSAFGSFDGSAADPALGDQKPAPRIEFGSTVFDFGRIACGESVKHSFLFTNTGTATLEVIEVKPGCGCTSAGVWDRLVQPGKTGAVPLQFNSGGFAGAVAKTATIICNDPRQSNIVLQLAGSVWKPIEVIPSVVVFQPTEAERGKQTKVVRIVSNLDEPLTLSNPECNDPSFQAELKGIALGKEFELQITVLPPFTNRYSGGTITLKTSAKQAPLLSISASIVVQLELAAIPQQLLIAPGPLAASLTSFVTIINHSKQEVTFSEPRVNDPRVEVRIRDISEQGDVAGSRAIESRLVSPGKQVTVAVEFPAGFELRQKLGLTLKTTHPKYPLLTIPVSKM